MQLLEQSFLDDMYESALMESCTYLSEGNYVDMILDMENSRTHLFESKVEKDKKKKTSPLADDEMEDIIDDGYDIDGMI